MTVIDDIMQACRSVCPRIVLSEGEDPRIIEAAIRATADGLARTLLIGDEAKIRGLFAGRPGSERIGILDPMRSTKTESYAQTYFELRKHKGVDIEAARKAMQSGLGFAAMMVRQGDADGTIGGAVATTADTVRTAFQIIGKQPAADSVSSFFIMMLKEPYSRPVLFADCALIVLPTSEQLASIAISSAASFKAVTGEEPRVAMLSFSTKGSAQDESVDRVRSAVDMIKAKEPGLIVDGEIQFDAALIPDIQKRKAPGSPLDGPANVFVFPSLEAGNIGYKIAERIGGADALGPVLQGLAKPANDLSRGCSADDVYQLIGITGAQVAASAT